MRCAFPFALLSFALLAHGQAATAPEIEFFETKVRPVLAEHCYKCHGPEKQKGDLRFDSREAILKGTDGVPSAIPGKPAESPLVKSVRHQTENHMPAKEPKLPEEQIAALAEWVRMGLPWPEADKNALTPQQDRALHHWSFQPIRNPAPPAVLDAAHWAQSLIDQFVLARMEAAKLAPAPRADKRTLLRRATFDLTGLPPTAAEVEAFEQDKAPDAFARVVDRLLASPRYGERWGRHWLDVARYADTRGYLVAGQERKFAYSYTYRDWVIQALNADLPYDQFIIQQLAADQLVLGRPEADPTPLAAMGFLTVGRSFLNNQQDIIDDRIDVVSRGLMGLTTTCARCHDHKFDPISQKDYYALYGVFASSNEPKELPILKDIRPASVREEYDREMAKLTGERTAFTNQARGMRAWVLTATLGIPVVPPLDPLTYDAAEKKTDVAIKNKIERLNGSELSPPRAMVMVDNATPFNPHVLLRGNPGRPGEAVPRRFLTVLSKGEPQPFPTGSGRLDLAKAIASKENPLTARVIVNRVWAYHFGRGLVRTPGDFGAKGEPPTHPELLDYLATRFMAEGWSLKKLHKEMLLSSTWQQSCDVTEKVALADPENRLLTRMNRQRLDFEAVRDSLLCVSGQLDLTAGGVPVELTKPPYAKRRAVYGFVDRQNLPGVFRTFDFASPDTTSPQRHVTSVPQQALFMMNSPFVLEQAQALAKKVGADGEPKPALVQSLYREVLARLAAPGEVQAGEKFVTAQLQPRPAMEDEAPSWQYGYGQFDPATRNVDFTSFKVFKENTWRNGPVVPDPVTGYASLRAEGGHPGHSLEQSVIRRWIAPADAIVDLTGRLDRPSKDGDGVLGRVVSSRTGQLGEFACEPAKTIDTNISAVEVKKGDLIDFILEPRANDNSDSFLWPLVIKTPTGDWDSKLTFSGPPAPKQAPLTAWEKYTHVLLSTNEFMFVD
jgi:mono/diheme cytochrome c family protein